MEHFKLCQYQYWRCAYNEDCIYEDEYQAHDVIIQDKAILSMLYDVLLEVLSSFYQVLSRLYFMKFILSSLTLQLFFTNEFYLQQSSDQFQSIIHLKPV